MPVSARRWTVGEVRAMQDVEHASPRFELIDDELLVTPSPARAHQRAVLRIVAALDAYVATQGLGVVEISPADIQLTPETIVQPDVFVSPERPILWCSTSLPCSPRLPALRLPPRDPPHQNDQSQ